MSNRGIIDDPSTLIGPHTGVEYLKLHEMELVSQIEKQRMEIGVNQLILEIPLSEEDRQSLQPSPQSLQQTLFDGDAPIITQFQPVSGQLRLNEANIHRIDPKSGETILHNYCKYINSTPIHIFKYLIENKGCDINIQSKSSVTPVHYAFRHFNPNKGGDINTLIYLLNQDGINVNMKSNYGETILHYACENINNIPLVMLEYLIEDKGCDITIQSQYIGTPVHYAFRWVSSNQNGEINKLKYLLNQDGIDVNMQGNEGHTILHYACENINGLSLDIFRYLIEDKGCNIYIQSTNLDTPIHGALGNFDPNKGGDINTLIYLLNLEDTDVNMKTNNGRTILHYVCENINNIPLYIFRYLIGNKGGDVNTRNNDENAPIHDAFRCFNSNDGDGINILIYLLNLGDTDVNMQGNEGHTILHYVCDNVNAIPLNIIEYLIEKKGLKINCLDHKGNTPLHLLITKLSSKGDSNVSQTAEYLIQKGISINHKNSDQLTALDELSQYNSTHPLTYGVLIKNGAKFGEDC
jgi:ankyrin repeat protein